MEQELLNLLEHLSEQNDHKKKRQKDKQTNNDLQNIKLKIEPS
jgi:hypothetical protein